MSNNLEKENLIKRISKNILLYTFILVLLIAIYNLLLYLSSSFPSSMMRKNVEESSEIFLREGNHYLFLNFIKYAGVDNYTNALQVNEAYSIDSNDIVYSYMSTRKNYDPEITKYQMQDTNKELVTYKQDLVDENSNPVSDDDYDIVGELSEFLKGNVHTSVTYSRYWHGYLVFLRPMLLFFNILEIRFIIIFFMVILLVYFIYLLKKKIGKDVAIVFAVVLVSMGYIYQSYSIQVVPVIGITMISSLILLMNIEKYDFKKFNIHIFITASLANFVDFLTIPIISAGIPILVFYLYKRKDFNTVEENTSYIKQIIIQSLVWILGYGLTWASKWILYDILFHSGEVSSALTQVMYRAHGEKVDFEYYENLFFNFMFYHQSAITCFFMLICLIFNKETPKYNKKGKIIKKRKNLGRIIKEESPLILISLMPIAWTIVLYNHTILHALFTYVGYSVFLIPLFTIIQDIIYNKLK